MNVRPGLVVLFRKIARIYFREIEVAGDVPRPGTRGRLFAANHVNGLIDPILVLTQAPCVISPVAKSTLWSVPGLRWLLGVVDAVPIVRRRDAPEKTEGENDAVFAKVASHLGGGGNILIFPEGTSHNEPRLLPLRSGAGRMLSRAAESVDRARTEHDGPTFQAVALEFDERDVFRSRALVLFGPVRHVRDLRGSEIAPEVTSLLRDDLTDLLVEGRTWDERLLLVRVAELYAKDAGDTSLANLNALGRRIARARELIDRSSPEDAEAAGARVRRYFERLEREETSDDDVLRAARGDAAPTDLARTATLAATLPLAAIGVLLYWLPYQLPRFVTGKLGGDPDVASTYKLGVGLLVFPAWGIALTALALLLAPSVALAAVAVSLAVLSPFAALLWVDRWDRLGVGRLLAPSEERRARMNELVVERAGLMRDLEVLRERAAV